MVCIAAFIILLLMSGFVAFLSLFKKELGKKYWKVFKKAWACVWTRMKLQKCETNFKDDVKNSILKHFVLKRPKLVKPISVIIEISAILIVFISAWSLIEASKAGLALMSLGTCNVSMPSSCSLTSETCSIERETAQGFLGGIIRWGEEWGEIFKALPESFKNWKAEDFLVAELPLITEAYREAPKALDIVDPLCSSCLQTYRNQKKKDFYKKYNTYLMFYPIKITDLAGDKKIKFSNSETITKYIYAINFYEANLNISVKDRSALKIIDRIFSEYDNNHVNYQTVLANLEEPRLIEVLEKWAKEFNQNLDIKILREIVNDKKMEEYLEKIASIVDGKIKARGIPTMIYNGRKHLGAYRG